jgi:hypothetical protein
VSGNLNITSLQDTSSYVSKERNSGGSISSPISRSAAFLNLQRGVTSTSFNSMI